MKEADQNNFKMKWFSGNSSTNAEGKFEYQEPKLLRVSRITDGEEVNNLNPTLDDQSVDEKEATGILALFFTIS